MGKNYYPHLLLGVKKKQKRINLFAWSPSASWLPSQDQYLDFPYFLALTCAGYSLSASILKPFSALLCILSPLTSGWTSQKKDQKVEGERSWSISSDALPVPHRCGSGNGFIPLQLMSRASFYRNRSLGAPVTLGPSAHPLPFRPGQYNSCWLLLIPGTSSSFPGCFSPAYTALSRTFIQFFTTF